MCVEVVKIFIKRNVESVSLDFLKRNRLYVCIYVYPPEVWHITPGTPCICRVNGTKNLALWIKKL
jgi:hypothetical protein